MKTGFLITARLKSSRLPLKLLMTLQGREVVRHVIDRAKQVAGIDEIILCTSTDPQDQPLVEIARQEGIHYFMGDGTDVLKRLKDAAQFFRVDSFISMTADNPLFCVYHANRLSNLIRQNPKTDFAYLSGLPIGTSPYALRTNAVDVVCQIKQDSDTEIWGPFINRPDFFDVQSIDVSDEWKINARLTLDEPVDYSFMTALVRASACRQLLDLDLNTISTTLHQHPQLLSINGGIVQRGLDPAIQSKIDLVFSQQVNKIRQLISASY